MQIHYLQHVPFEGPGCIADWAAEHGHDLSATRLFDGEQPPPITEIDWLVVMGGPMNIYQDDLYPWLMIEKTYIREAVQAEKVILGICLGAQLIADVLGGPVSRNPEGEIGWFPLYLTESASKHALFNSLPPELDAYHWHGDTFALPPGCVLLASSEACTNQAFMYGGRILGFQFHIEMRFEDAQRLIKNCGDEITDGAYMQSAEAMLADPARFQQANAYMVSILDQLAAP